MNGNFLLLHTTANLFLRFLEIYGSDDNSDNNNNSNNNSKNDNHNNNCNDENNCNNNNNNTYNNYNKEINDIIGLYSPHCYLFSCLCSLIFLSYCFNTDSLFLIYILHLFTAFLSSTFLPRPFLFS